MYNITDDIVVVGTNEGTIYFSHIQDLTKPFYIAFHEKSVIQVDFCNNGSIFEPDIYYAASSSADGQLKFWNYKNRREIRSAGYIGRIIPLGM